MHYRLMITVVLAGIFVFSGLFSAEFQQKQKVKIVKETFYPFILFYFQSKIYLKHNFGQGRQAVFLPPCGLGNS